MITLKQVEAFYWVGVLGSFAAAADKINVAQSTVSKRIQEMEQTLGIELFDREMRSGRLTQKGTEMLVLGEKILRMRDRFTQAAQNQSAVTGTLRIGITELVAITWLSALIAEIKRTYPLLVIEPIVDQVVPLYQRLEDRSVDLVIGPRIYKDDRFTSKLLAKVHQAWMCSPDVHPGGKMPIGQLKNFPLLMQSNGSGLLFMITKLLEENGVRAKSVISCNGMMALAEMAMSGLGVTCLPRFYFEDAINSGKLVVIETDPQVPPLQYAVASRHDAVANLGGAITEMAVAICNFTDLQKVTI